jgi:hypothetical protein
MEGLSFRIVVPLVLVLILLGVAVDLIKDMEFEKSQRMMEKELLKITTLGETMASTGLVNWQKVNIHIPVDVNIVVIGGLPSDNGVIREGGRNNMFFKAGGDMKIYVNELDFYRFDERLEDRPVVLYPGSHILEIKIFEISNRSVLGIRVVEYER